LTGAGRADPHRSGFILISSGITHPGVIANPKETA
jgi:hypothetical protein